MIKDIDILIIWHTKVWKEDNNGFIFDINDHHNRLLSNRFIWLVLVRISPSNQAPQNNVTKIAIKKKIIINLKRKKNESKTNITYILK